MWLLMCALMLIFCADYGQSSGLKATYDPDAFDSMAVMNSEIWNLGGGEEGGVTSKDLLPNVRHSLIYIFPDTERYRG